MRVPERLLPLVEQGIVEQVVMPLQAGKEAQVFLVRAGGELRVAKVYKEVEYRGFRNRADYTDGRKVRSSRSQRAIDKRSAFGRRQEEQAWHAAEVDALYRISAAGVRVPEPHAFVDGVLVMELVSDDQGRPAPRLADLSLDRVQAVELFHLLLREVVKMLCSGIVHADLSDFNVLMGQNGPVLIDFPQAVDPATNNHARRLLIRDVNNLTRILGRFAPKLRRKRYGQEIWALYERGDLKPDTPLTGKVQRPSQQADVDAVLAEIAAIERETQERREALGLPPAKPPRAPVVAAKPPRPVSAPPEKAEEQEAPAPKKRRRRRRRKPANPEAKGTGDKPAQDAKGPKPSGASTRKRRRSRSSRRRKKPGQIEVVKVGD